MLRCDSSAMIRSKKPTSKRLEALHHRRVGGEVDALVAVLRRGRGDEGAGLAGQELLEDVVGLLAQFPAVAEEQDALGPAGPQQDVAERDGDTGLAGAGGLDDQGLAVLGGEPLDDPLDGLDLVHAAGDAGVGRRSWSAAPGWRRWKMQVLEAVLGVEAVELAGRLALGVVPDPDVVAVGVEDDRALAVVLLQAVGVALGLGAARLGVDRRSSWPR